VRSCGINKLSVGKQVIKKRPIMRRDRNGRTAGYKVTTGSRKRELEMNKLIPTGGVEYPISRLVRKITPRCVISTP